MPKVLRPGLLCLAVAGLSASLFIASCSTRPSAALSTPPLEWRLVPSTTVLGDRRQFMVYGARLTGVQAVSDPSVKVEPGWVKEDGKVFSMYLTVGPLGDRAVDSTVLGEKPGLRKVKVTTADTVVTFSLKILDER